MQYTITNVSYLPIELDEEIIAINFTICLSEPEVIQFESFLPLGTLLRFIRQSHPAFYRYWQTTRKSLDLFGSAEASTLEAIGEEARAQLSTLLLEYIGADQWMEHTYAYHKNQHSITLNDTESASLDAIADGLQKEAFGLNENQQRYKKFCEQVNNLVRQVAMELYPVIENMEADKLRSFQNLFADEIVKMEEKLCSFIAE